MNSLSHCLPLFCFLQLRGTGAIVLCALLDFFTFAICLPYSETSDGAAFDCLLRLIAKRGRALFRLFHVSSTLTRLRPSLIETEDMTRIVTFRNPGTSSLGHVYRLRFLYLSTTF